MFLLMTRRPLSSTLFPYTTLFRSCSGSTVPTEDVDSSNSLSAEAVTSTVVFRLATSRAKFNRTWAALPRRTSRSEEHTSELQSRRDLVCRLLLEKKKAGLSVGYHL